MNSWRIDTRLIVWWVCAIGLSLISRYFESSEAAVVTRGPYLQMLTSTSLTVCWRTDEATSSVVFYGGDPLMLYQVAGDLQPTTNHEVRVYGLLPETRYYYSVGSLVEAFLQGPDYFFDTAPPEGISRSTRIWAIGDCGTTGLAPGAEPYPPMIAEFSMYEELNHDREPPCNAQSVAGTLPEVELCR